MKIVVTVKEIAEVEDQFEISGLDIDEHYLNYDLNEWDDYAVEEAVQIQEENDDVDIVAVTIGPERTEETIRIALAKGADRAVRVWDEALDGMDLLDIHTKATILSAIVEQEAADLVLTGVQAGDVANAATGVSLAERLGFEWAAVVNEIDLDQTSDVASVHRELEGGIEELTDVQLPAVLTVQTGINEPRYASLRGIRQAQQKELAVTGLDELGLEAAVTDTPISRTSMYESESETETILWEGSTEETASELADLLRETEVVQG